MLISGQALLEIAGTLAVFLGGLGSHEAYLRNMGLVTLASAFISACVGITSLGFDHPMATTLLLPKLGGAADLQGDTVALHPVLLTLNC